MNLFQRIRKPFGDGAEDEGVPPGPAPPRVGALLRQRREDLGLTLEAIGEALRIRPAYLAALEEGRAEELPGPTYAIGFVRAYAHYLGFDADRVLDRYKAESVSVNIRPDLTLPVPLGERSLPGVPILLVGLILALCGYGTWYYLSTAERSRPERVAAVPTELRRAAEAPVPHAEAPRGEPVASASGLASGAAPGRETSSPPAAGAANAAGPDVVANPAAAALPAAAPESAGAPPAVATAPAAEAAKAGGEIEIRALADCWIQVRSGDTQAIVFSRVLKAGESYRVPRSGLLLRTGNAGALAITVDGKPAPSIGRIGTLRRSVALDPAELLAGTAVHG